jgi:hypothetical protein
MRDFNDHIVPVSFPVRFTINEGDTYASWLARVVCAAPCRSRSHHRDCGRGSCPLEGVKLRVADLRRVKSRLSELLDSGGMERLEEKHAGSPAAVEELPVISIKGLSSRSILGRHLSEFKISDVAGMTKREFMEKAMKNVDVRDRQKVEPQAKQVWVTAVRLAGLSRAWRKQ